MDSSIKIGSAIALLALIGAAYAAPMSVWTCRKCQLTVKSEGRPQMGTCPEKGGHDYFALLKKASGGVMSMRDIKKTVSKTFEGMSAEQRKDFLKNARRK